MLQFLQYAVYFTLYFTLVLKVYASHLDISCCYHRVALELKVQLHLSNLYHAKCEPVMRMLRKHMFLREPCAWNDVRKSELFD